MRDCLNITLLMSEYKYIKMNKARNILMLVIAAFILSCCSKDIESYPKQPVPDWFIESPELLPNSFTAIISIPDNLNVYASENDKVAAFINDRCRGIGNLVTSDENDKRVYYLTIRSEDNESGIIRFKYYNSRLSYLYQAKQTIPFETDGTYGTYDTPVILEMEHLLN